MNTLKIPTPPTPFLTSQPTAPPPILSQSDLQSIANLYDSIRYLYRSRHLNLDTQLTSQFDQTVESVITDLSKRLKDNPSTDSINAVRVICAKYALMDMCFTKVIAMFGVAEQEVEGVLAEIHDGFGAMWKEVIAGVLAGKEEQQSVSREIQQASGKAQVRQRELERVRRHRDELQQQLIELTKQNEMYLSTLAHFHQPTLPTTSPPFSNPSLQTPLTSSASLSTLPLPKPLTLPQTLQLIHDLTSSKLTYDKNCRQQSRPYQTLQQYMYTFLNEKYGLKSLTVEWAMSLVNAIKKYSAEENEVAVFGKIMRNQIQEEFQVEQREVQRKLDGLLKRRVGGSVGGEVSSKLVGEVIGYLYSREEADNLLQIILGKSSGNKAIINYQTLIQVLLDNNMKKHEKFLMPFLKEFKKVDTDGDGILSQPQFRFLFSKFARQDHQKLYNHFLQALDPSSSNRICFSNVCWLFQSKPQNGPLLANP